MQLSLATLPHRLYRWFGIERRRGVARDQAAVCLDRRRIFILPTRQGVLYAFITFVMLIGAANYNNSVAFLLTFLLIGLGLVGLVQTYRNMAGIRLRAGQATPAFAGGRARYEIAVDRPEGGARRALYFEVPGEAPVWFDIEARATTVEIEAPAEHRGRRPLGRIGIATRYPLGLFRARAWLHFDRSCLVYPRPARDAVHPRVRGGDGRSRSTPRSGDGDFAGHRAYTPGDPPRRIDWKAAARTDRLLTRHLEDEGGTEVWLAWDECTGDAETRLSRLCRGVLDAEKRGARYGLRLPATPPIAPGCGASHRRRCLEALALHGITS